MNTKGTVRSGGSPRQALSHALHWSLLGVVLFLTTCPAVCGSCVPPTWQAAGKLDVKCLLQGRCG